eukprot:7393285-Ditylum_brightwellii.AAC.1
MSSEGNGLNTAGESQKQQGGTSLLFLDHDFASYHTTQWLQWELNVQLMAKGASQLNGANKVGNKVGHKVGNKVKALLIKLLAIYGKDNINVLSKIRRRLEVENFLKIAREVKDLLAYETMDRKYKN